MPTGEVVRVGVLDQVTADADPEEPCSNSSQLEPGFHMQTPRRASASSMVSEQTGTTNLTGAPSQELPVEFNPHPAAADTLLHAGDHREDVVSGTKARSDHHPKSIQELDNDLVERDPGSSDIRSTQPELETDEQLKFPVVAVDAIKDPGAAVVPHSRKVKRTVITRLGRREAAQHRRSRFPADPPLDTSLGPLNRELFAASIKAETLFHRFLPDSELLRLVNPASVFREHKRCRSRFRRWGLRRGPGRSDGSLHELAAAICGDATELSKSYRRIFAILVMMGLPWKVLNFIRHSNTDDGLPYEGREGRGFKVRYYRLVPNSYPDISKPHPESKGPEGETQQHGKALKLKRLRSFRGWTRSKKRKFEGLQWMVRAPFFARRSDADNPIHLYDLPDKAIVPFTLWQRFGEGGAGEVFKVRIHPAHHGFERKGTKLDQNDSLFAVKRLFCPDMDTIRAETRMFKLLSREDHPHLNSLLTTYTQDAQFHLVFHWAEWDLWKYWQNHDPRSSTFTKYGGSAGDSSTALWLARECAGLASGLLKIHGPHDPASFAHQDSFGVDVAQMTAAETADAAAAGPPPPRLCHHGDIKAINILLFPRDGTQLVPALPGLPPPEPRHAGWTLKISDFGLAGFRKPGAARTGGTAWTPKYIPPEWVTRPESVEKPACDIWALGCVFLQFIGWYLGGFKLVEHFEDARKDEDGTIRFYRLPAGPEVIEGGGAVSASVKGSVTEVRQAPGYEREHVRAQ
ncbi:hypothetical protein INS49_004523 [Diaporthe citri]|uniref:uncharacterized protein n=1 Tax=Diaporthe citri TaxID=83186 RepID=UPI001C805AE0|nr:uncharacterized protein INS49_004523 [Diaporthe citri]KAG6354506.1 hypothetical protein INS49_004523 [Diaporthe citri]